MNNKFKTVAIIPNATKDPDYLASKKVFEVLKENNIETLMDLSHQKSGIDAKYVSSKNLGNAELIIVLGGDGTLLSVVRDYAKTDAMFLGINYGNLGFLTEIEKENISYLNDILNGNYTVANHLLLNVETDNFKMNGLNDLSIHRDVLSGMINFELYIDNTLLYNVKADGLIVATPTGSTAYSMSAGGPILDPTIDALVITPICAHDLISRSVIVPTDKEIKIKMIDCSSFNAAINIDGQVGYKIKTGDKITVTAGNKVKLIRTNDSSFYKRLKYKMFRKDI